MELIINILISLLAGVVAGIHSGIVVARMAKFEELKNQIKRIIWGIDYTLPSGLPPQISSQSNIRTLTDISSDFYALKHRSAGDKTAFLSSSVSNVFSMPPNQFEEIDKLYAEWQKTCRELKPNLRIIFSIRPWV